jgi:hypothetical protein
MDRLAIDPAGDARRMNERLVQAGGLSARKNRVRTSIIVLRVVPHAENVADPGRRVRHAGRPLIGHTRPRTAQRTGISRTPSGPRSS